MNMINLYPYTPGSYEDPRCGYCYTDFSEEDSQQSWIAHTHGGEKHPIHLTCARSWAANQIKQGASTSCMTCQKPIFKSDFDNFHPLRKRTYNSLHLMPNAFAFLSALFGFATLGDNLNRAGEMTSPLFATLGMLGCMWTMAVVSKAIIPSPAALTMATTKAGILMASSAALLASCYGLYLLAEETDDKKDQSILGTLALSAYPASLMVFHAAAETANITINASRSLWQTIKPLISNAFTRIDERLGVRLDLNP